MYNFLRKPAALLALTLAVTSSPAMAEIWTASGFKTPESVLFDPQRNVFYVSNVDGSPNAKDGKGHISQVSSEGDVIALEWVTGLDAPKGLALHGDLLYVTDIDRLVAINVVEGTISQTWEAEGAKFLNDPAVDSAGRVFVTDMLTNAIYVLEGDAISLWLQDTALQHPNGLSISGDDLIIAPWGQEIQADFSTKVGGHLIAVDMATKSITTLGSGAPIGNLDGLEPVGTDEWLVTDWMAGSLLRVNADGTHEVLQDLNTGSADLEVIEETGVAVIPMMNDGTLVAIKID